MRIRDGKNSNPGSARKKFGSGIRDGKNSDSGSRKKIPDPRHCFYHIEKSNLDDIFDMFRMIRDVEELLEGKEAASISPRSPALPLLNPEGSQLDSENHPSDK
jgi:hypothetical protein